MVTATIDTTRFEIAFKQYLNETSKTVEDAINFKLYDAGRAALKATGKASKPGIRKSLDDVSLNNPRMTVAEMIVVALKRKDGAEIYNLEEETDMLKNSRFRSIGFAKAGWLPGIKNQASKINRFFNSTAKVKDFLGGSQPARKNGSTYHASIYNDVTGNPASSTIERFKEIGAQAGVDKVTSDIESYLEKKLGIPAEKFNRG